MAEGKILGDAVSIGRVDLGGSAQAAAAFGVLGLEQVALAGSRTHYFAASGDLESFGNRFLSFIAFGTSHKSSCSKEPGI
jgi:hypothetical protein